jgi:hypothetical protein
MGLIRGRLSLVSTTEELLERKSSGFDLESREYGCRDPSRWSRGTLYPQKLALTSPTSSGLSFGIVRSRTQATKFSLRHEAQQTPSTQRHSLEMFDTVSQAFAHNIVSNTVECSTVSTQQSILARVEAG